MSMFVHKGGGGVKKPGKTVHMVCRCRLIVLPKWTFFHVLTHCDIWFYYPLLADHSDNPSPEKTATAISTALFLWFDKIIWKGLRKTIETKDLWDLNLGDRYT